MRKDLYLKFVVGQVENFYRLILMHDVTCADFSIIGSYHSSAKIGTFIPAEDGAVAVFEVIWINFYYVVMIYETLCRNIFPLNDYKS